MEPTDEDFIKHHDFQNAESLGGSVHPVFLADGIHYQVNGAIVKELPRLTERSLKAKGQWFGLLCLAGIGMFLEGYSKYSFFWCFFTFFHLFRDLLI